MKRKLKIFSVKEDARGSNDAEISDELKERSLILSAMKGAREALHSLYESHRDRIYALIYHLSGDPILAEDLLHEVFVKVYKALPRFRFESSFSTWIYSIAINEVRYHKRQTRNSIPLNNILGGIADCDATPDQIALHIQRQRQELVRQAVLKLPPKLRTVIVLKYVEGLSYEEISAVLKCSQGTVASRLSRALQKLEVQLRPFEKMFSS